MRSYVTTRVKRLKATSRPARRLAAELGRIIRSRRTSTADRQAALARLDLIAPPIHSVLTETVRKLNESIPETEQERGLEALKFYFSKSSVEQTKLRAQAGVSDAVGFAKWLIGEGSLGKQ